MHSNIHNDNNVQQDVVAERLRRYVKAVVFTGVGSNPIDVILLLFCLRMVRDDAVLVLAPASGGDISISASSVVSEDASEVGSQSSLEDSA
eukprot:scaffold9113_cov129-Skeletonema_marinoi.AAC.1